MVTDGCIDLKKLSLDELLGVVEIYPWFGCARKELCLRMAALGDKWSGSQYAEAALHIGSRRVIYDIMRTARTNTPDTDALMKTYSAPERKVRASYGDFFSQNDYDNVRKKDDNVFASFAAAASSEKESHAGTEVDADFCTETLAQIYTEQGYYDQAKSIYSKLILRYPEKNAYFAALIEKLDRNPDN